MPEAGLSRVHPASLMSDAVPRRIARAGRSGFRVHSIYRSVINVATCDGLLTIASPDAGGLPNGIQADLGPDWRAIGVQAGMVVLANDSGVGLPEAGLEIRLKTATTWSPRFRSLGEGDHDVMRCWPRRTVPARAIARTRASAGGFGPLLGGAVGSSDILDSAGGAWPILNGLVAALESGDRGVAAAVATRLIGLGPGLTPSGDDALVGIEAALHALDCPMAGFLSLALDRVEDRTPALAATLLRHAAAGEFAERLHRLIGALLGPDDGLIAMAIDRATAWGATSGTDSLVGVLIGLDLAAGVRGAVH
jgi:hypothetical protein